MILLYYLNLISFVGLDWNNNHVNYRLYRCLVLFLFGSFIMTEVMFVFQSGISLLSAVKALNVIIFHMSGAYQVIMMRFYSPAIHKIINELNSDRLYKNHLTKSAHEFANKYVVFITILIAFELLFTFLRAYLYVPKREILKPVMQELPYNSWFPFDLQQSRKHYNMAFFYQFFSITLSGYVVAIPHLLIPGIMIHITGHFQALAYEFERLRKEQILHPNQSIDDEVRKYFIYLQRILSIAMDFRDITAICVIGLLPTAFIFCASLLITTTEPIVESSTELSYAIAIFIDLAMHCWFGNELTLQSGYISREVYALDWCQVSRRIQNDVYFTLMRLDCPIVITIGKVVPLTLNTLVNILRTTYSFYTLLVQMAE